MNTGIQDAHNLAWKLALVVKGVASRSVLQTYEMERRPVLFCLTFLSFATLFPFYLEFLIHNDILLLEHFQIALSNTALSIQNFRAAMAVPAALGLDPIVANSGKESQILSLCIFFHTLSH